MFVSNLSRIYWYCKYILAKQLARISSNARLYRKPVKNILVLCYGNIYRSPFVEYYLQMKLTGDDIYQVQSAGFHQKTGRKSETDFVRMVKEYGVDLTHHRSKIVDRELLSWADFIVIMDGKNYKLSLQIDRGIENKLIWLGSLCKGTPVEIADPYGKNQIEQRLIVDQMAKATDCLIDHLQ